MNRRIGFVAVAVAMAALGTTAAAQVRVGPVAVASWSNLIEDPEGLLTYDVDQRWGGGVAVEVPLGRHFSLLAEPMLIEKGAQGTPSGGEEGLRTVTRLRYLEVPVLARFTLGSWKVRPHLSAGASVGWLQDATVRTELDGGSEEVDVRDGLTGTDVGILLGAGVSATLGPGKYFLEGRFVQGLRNLDRSGETKVHSQGLQLLAGVTFSF